MRLGCRTMPIERLIQIISLDCGLAFEFAEQSHIHIIYPLLFIFGVGVMHAVIVQGRGGCAILRGKSLSLRAMAPKTSKPMRNLIFS